VFIHFNEGNFIWSSETEVESLHQTLIRAEGLNKRTRKWLCRIEGRHNYLSILHFLILTESLACILFLKNIKQSESFKGHTKEINSIDT